MTATPIALRLSPRDRVRFDRLRRPIEVKGRRTRESRADVVRRLIDLGQRETRSNRIGGGTP